MHLGRKEHIYAAFQKQRLDLAFTESSGHFTAEHYPAIIIVKTIILKGNIWSGVSGLCPLLKDNLAPRFQ